LVRTVHFYEALSRERLDQDIDIPDAGLHIIAVGSFLILVLNEALLGTERYRQATATRVTILNADLEKAVAMAVADGAHIAAPKFTVPHGSGSAFYIQRVCSLNILSTAKAHSTSTSRHPCLTKTETSIEAQCYIAASRCC
jgi:predicted enzyme related to lactoylglutathione lyase